MRKIFVLNIDNESFELDKLPTNFEKKTRKINIYINYNHIKIKGLEEYSFYFELKIDFDELNYTVYLKNKVIDYLYQKNYENLTPLEIKKIVDKIVKSHNSQLELVLNKKLS